MTVTLALVRRLALGSLLANVGIVLTGGAVRLTGSGLGCPTWPQCTGDSWVATSEMGVHGTVEFGNRLLTFVLSALAVAGLVAAWRLRPRPRGLLWPAAGVLAGVAAQGAIGGVTVLTDLNPWIVGSHYLVSIGIIAVAYTFWRRAGSGGRERPAAPAPGPLRGLAWVTVTAALALLAAGTVVTGSGPHAGDADVPRNGLDPGTVSQAHASLAYLLLGLAVASWFAARAAAGRRAVRAAAVLVAVILAQAAVGVVQYYAGLPEPLVGLHLLGSCLTWLAALDLLHHLPAAPRQAAGPPDAAPPDTGRPHPARPGPAADRAVPVG